MKRHFFTIDEDRKILTMRAAGMTNLQISLITGLVLGSIHSRIGLLKRKGVRSVEDLDNPELQVKRNFTPDDGLVVAELRNSGMSYPEISAHTGFALGSIHRLMHIADGTPIDASDEKRAKKLEDRKKYVALHPFNREAKKVAEVRCLGGCGQMFKSPDRMRIRICRACKERHKDAAIRGGFDDFMLRM